MDAVQTMNCENSAAATCWNYIQGWVHYAVTSGQGMSAETLLDGFTRAEAAGNMQRAAVGLPPTSRAVDYLTGNADAA